MCSWKLPSVRVLVVAMEPLELAIWTCASTIGAPFESTTTPSTVSRELFCWAKTDDGVKAIEIRQKRRKGEGGKRERGKEGEEEKTRTRFRKKALLNRKSCW